MDPWGHGAMGPWAHGPMGPWAVPKPHVHGHTPTQKEGRPCRPGAPRRVLRQAGHAAERPGTGPLEAARAPKDPLNVGPYRASEGNEGPEGP